MINLKYEIEIDAPRERVWEVLWNEESYAKWTSPFSPTSQVKSAWTENGEVLFLDGNNCGMVSVIERLDAPSSMIFRHKGMIENGVTTMFGEDSDWKDSKEAYRLDDSHGGTRLRVEVETAENYTGFMNDAFPKALEIVRKLSE